MTTTDEYDQHEDAEEVVDATGDAAQKPQEQPQDAQDAQDAQEPAADQQEEEEGDGGNQEAARYRRRLRETEAERDQLADRLEAMQRAEVERLAGTAQVKPAALWASGAQLADLLTETGTVDPAKVATAAKTARTELGLAPPRPGTYVPTEGRNPDTSKSSGWAAAFKVRGA